MSLKFGASDVSRTIGEPATPPRLDSSMNTTRIWSEQVGTLLRDLDPPAPLLSDAISPTNRRARRCYTCIAHITLELCLHSGDELSWA